MVSANHWLVMYNAWCSNSGTSVGGVMAWAIVMMSRRGKTTSGSRSSGNLWITETLGAAVALPELDARALGVAVPWARAETLLLLVVAGKEELDNSGQEEENCSKNGNSEAGRVEAACSAKRHRISDSSVLVVVAVEAFL